MGMRGSGTARWAVYDVTDEMTDRTYSTLLHLLRTMPDHAAKNVLAAILEETALMEALLCEAGGTVPEGEARGDALGRFWEIVQEGRDAKAAALLQNLARMES
jgi:hypothetical protein